MKKKTLLLIMFLVLAVFILSVVTFYLIPFSKVNETIVSSNKTNGYSVDDTSFISQENYEKMCVVNRKISDNEYVQIKTKNRFKICAIDKVEITSLVTASIDSLDEVKTKDTYEGYYSVYLSFEEGKWGVTEVQRNE
ncbi:MAG: hypothetical protein MJ083_02025 [Clostridia bacterium]|nr:hypothetical protein [Clostridia bacterium]